MAAVLVLSRLCEPSSELHIAEDWYRRTALEDLLEDLLGVAPEVVSYDRLYRTLDKIEPHKVVLEQHLRRRLGELFHLDYDLMLYDVTSTYFEGLTEGNELAKRGHSRDHRPDCTASGGDVRVLPVEASRWLQLLGTTWMAAELWKVGLRSEVNKDLRHIDSREARQSARRLKVTRAVGQRYRAIRAPGGFTRG